MRTTEENSVHFADLSRQLNEESDVTIARQFIGGMKKNKETTKNVRIRICYHISIRQTFIFN